MEFTQNRNIKYIAALLFLTVASQAIYTLLYLETDLPRRWLWSLEGLLFVLLAAIGGAAMVQAKDHALGYSAIFASALLNLIQVGIGLTQFGPFREVSQSVEAIAPAAGSVVALSFFIYNAAKILLGIAAIVFGTAISQAGSAGLGKLTVFLGFAAIVTNSIVMMFGRIKDFPSGGIGVIATLFLAICFLKLRSED